MTLSPQQYKALTLLAAGYDRDYVASQTGVAKSTIHKWAIQEEFQKLLREACAKSFDMAIAELCSGAVEAAKELRQIIVDEDTPGRVKVSAIQVLLTTAAKAKESLLENRLEALEANLDGSANQSED
ncbi:hypothetical protein NIES4106_62170 (plasmid) [Fischerella sp. NIES-4106]|nr:hypothetical protein NIES4106_62170 [Fischerella sp. NIES-4106]